MERPLDELEKLILRHLASGPHSASELADALRTSSQAHGIAITQAKITYRLGGLVSLKLVGSVERKLPGQRRDFLYSLRAEPKATTEAAPPSVEAPKAEAPKAPKAEAPKATQELQPTEEEPQASPDPQASPEPCNVDLLIQQIRARHAALMAQADAVIASERPQGGHLR